MTPEEKAVIKAAIYLRYCIDAKTAGDPPRIGRLMDLVDALIFACPQCNAGGHTCPGDGSPIGHTQTDCGEHEEPDHSPGSADVLGIYCDDPAHCPPVDVAEWTPAVFSECLAGDRIRIGTDEATVLRISIGQWHADNTDPYHPRKWEHEELWMELDANPGLKQYPAETACEILMDQERAALRLLDKSFKGTVPVVPGLDSPPVEK